MRTQAEGRTTPPQHASCLSQLLPVSCLGTSRPPFRQQPPQSHGHRDTYHFQPASPTSCGSPALTTQSSAGPAVTHSCVALPGVMPSLGRDGAEPCPSLSLTCHQVPAGCQGRAVKDVGRAGVGSRGRGRDGGWGKVQTPGEKGPRATGRQARSQEPGAQPCTHHCHTHMYTYVPWLLSACSSGPAPSRGDSSPLLCRRQFRISRPQPTFHTTAPPRACIHVLPSHLTLEGREADGSSQPAGWGPVPTQGRVAPWQDAGTEHQAGEPSTAPPGAPRQDPTTASRLQLPQVGGQLTGEREGAGGDPQA